jgi:hypothetical protein
MRVGLGVVASVRPDLPATPWVGRAEGTRHSSAILGRALGGRDMALGVVVLAADGDRSLRRAVLAGAFADTVDGLATVIGFAHLPRRMRYGILAATFGAAIAGLLTAVAIGSDAPRSSGTPTGAGEASATGEERTPAS